MVSANMELQSKLATVILMAASQSCQTAALQAELIGSFGMCDECAANPDHRLCPPPPPPPGLPLLLRCDISCFCRSWKCSQQTWQNVYSCKARLWSQAKRPVSFLLTTCGAASTSSSWMSWICNFPCDPTTAWRLKPQKALIVSWLLPDADDLQPLLPLWLCSG